MTFSARRFTFSIFPLNIINFFPPNCVAYQKLQWNNVFVCVLFNETPPPHFFPSLFYVLPLGRLVNLSGEQKSWLVVVLSQRIFLVGCRPPPLLLFWPPVFKVCEHFWFLEYLVRLSRSPPPIRPFQHSVTPPFLASNFEVQNLKCIFSSVQFPNLE